MEQEVKSADVCTANHCDSDSAADAFAAVVLIAIFVSTCLFWIAGQ